MDQHTELTDRLSTLETKMDGVQETISEAKGTIKAGVLFMGVMNALLLPIMAWQLTSTVATRETNAVQDTRLQILEKACENRQSAIKIAPTVASKSDEPANPPKDKVRPATSPLAWRNEDEQ